MAILSRRNLRKKISVPAFGRFGQTPVRNERTFFPYCNILNASAQRLMNTRKRKAPEKLPVSCGNGYNAASGATRPVGAIIQG